MRRKPVVLVDMDEVLVSLLDAWCAHYLQLGGEHLVPEDFKHYGWESQVKNKELFLQVLKSGAIFSCAAARPRAVEGFAMLCERYDVFIVTAVMKNCSRTYDAKLGWLWRHFPWFDRSRVIFTSQKHLVHGDFLIDDSVTNLDAWVRADPAGERIPVLMDRPFNQETLPYHRVADLVEAFEFVRSSP